MLGPHARDFELPELVELVERLAAEPDRWRHLVSHRPDARTYEQLHRDDHVAVWLICWMNDHDTGFHDHDLSAGALAVAAGAVREERLVLGGPPARRLSTRDPLKASRPAGAGRGCRGRGVCLPHDRQRRAGL